MLFTASYIVAASQLFAVAFGAPLFNAEANEARSLVERAAYKVFGGDGTTAQGWPAQSDWKSFEDLWTANQAVMKSSCAQFNVPNNSADEITAIKKGLQDVAKQSNLPAEFLLAILMQESKGCVRVPTTNYGVSNPGLMQSFNGAHSCNQGGVKTPCPSDTIAGMIGDGAGVSLDFGLSQAIKQSTASDVSKFYKGARIYNSGSIAAGGNLGAGIATHCYSTDVANRLIGWADDKSGCQEASIGSVQGSAGTPTKPDTTTPAPPTATKPAATPSPPAANGNTNKPAGACTKFYTAKAGDFCSSTGIDLAKLRQLNPSINAQCTNFMAGTAYCVA